jgi:hypothetical protein
MYMEEGKYKVRFLGENKPNCFVKTGSEPCILMELKSSKGALELD